VTINTAYSLREFANDVARGVEVSNGNAESLSAALRKPVQRLVERDDLLTLGLPRPGNNVAESWYLYFDGDLSVVLFKVPEAPAVQPHDHGIWESLFVYRGQIEHSLYERIDDGSRDGFAQLTRVRSAVLNKGDVALVAPPQDIHGFRALNGDTYGITVSQGAYKPERNYYRPDQQTVEVRRPRTLR
jgi:predicted metal-dependent enzyme (double-stranded beta helix superfamily)